MGVEVGFFLLVFDYFYCDNGDIECNGSIDWFFFYIDLVWCDGGKCYVMGNGECSDGVK